MDNQLLLKMADNDPDSARRILFVTTFGIAQY